MDIFKKIENTKLVISFILSNRLTNAQLSTLLKSNESESMLNDMINGVGIRYLVINNNWNEFNQVELLKNYILKIGIIL